MVALNGSFGDDGSGDDVDNCVDDDDDGDDDGNDDGDDGDDGDDENNHPAAHGAIMKGITTRGRLDQL